MKREPDLTIGPLALWIHGYQFPDSKGYDDANWLRVTASCNAAGTRVEESGSFLTTSELQRWRADVERMLGAQTSEANLEPLEPYVDVRLTATGEGRIDGVVEISSDLSSPHEFCFDLDRSSLPTIIAQLRAITVAWPVRQRP